MSQPASPPLRHAAETVWTGLAMGLLTGGLQVLIVLVQRYGFGRLIWYGRDAIWMIPAASALVFAAFALLGATAILLFRIRVPTAVVAGGFGFLGVVTLLLPFGPVAPWARTLLALGVAIQLARSAGRNPVGWFRWLRRAAAGIAIAAATLGGGRSAAATVRRFLLMRGLAAASPGSPNVLLIILDTVRGDELSLYGYDRPTTPFLEKWAATGTVFEHAISTAPWTLPSHGSLFTGKLGDELGGGWVHPLQGSSRTIAEVLKDRGYRTGGFVGNLLYTSYESGLTRGFIDYQDYPRTLREFFLNCPLIQTSLAQSLLQARSFYDARQALLKLNLHVSRVPADEYVPARGITDRFLDWQAREPDRPFFAFLNYFDAHGPYRAPAPFLTSLAGDGQPRHRYDAAIAYLDSEINRLLEALERSGRLERTIVIVASDHGEHFGEHGLRGHANSLYLPLVRVPLVIRFPGQVPAGVRIPDPVSLRDVPATILDLVTGAPDPRFPGSSLVGNWDAARGKAAPAVARSQVIRSRDGNPQFPNDRTGLESVLDPGYHYIRSGLGTEELYAWRTDTLELNDLSRLPESAPILARLRAQAGAHSLTAARVPAP